MGCAARESNQRRRNPSHSARLMTRDSSVCVLSSAGCRELTAPIAPLSFVHMSRSKCSGSLGAFLSGLIVSFLGGAGRAPTADEEDAIADGSGWQARLPANAKSRFYSPIFIFDPLIR